MGEKRGRRDRVVKSEEVVLWADNSFDANELQEAILRHGYKVVVVATASDRPVAKTAGSFFWGYPGILRGLALQD